MLKLKRIAIQNFKSIQDMDFPVSPVSILVGRNNCGKSNILEACHLLKFAEKPVEMAHVALKDKCHDLDHDRQLFAFTFELPESMWESLFKGKNYKKLFIEYPNITFLWPFGWHKSIHHCPLFITDISLEDFKRWSSSPEKILHTKEIGFFTSEKVSASSTRHQIFDNNMIGNKFQDMLPPIYFSSAHRLSFSDDLIHLPETLDEEGSELTSFLFNKYNNYKLDYDRYLETVKDILPEIKDIYMNISKEKTARKSFKVSLNVVEKGSSISRDFKELGSGVEQVLILIAQVLFSKDGSIHLIDEPGGFLHPTAQRYLLDFFKDQSEHQNKTFLITSHSTSFVQHPDMNSLFHVIKDEQGTRVNPCSKAETVQDILADIDSKQMKQFEGVEKQYGLDTIKY